MIGRKVEPPASLDPKIARFIEALARSAVRRESSGGGGAIAPTERTIEETMKEAAAEPADLVDDFYRPFVRALGNLVITFAQAEAALLEMVAAHLQNELDAVALLKKPDAKDRVLALVEQLLLDTSLIDELRQAVSDFWAAKETRNRIIHDEWFPLFEDAGGVATRGFTRKKQPEEVLIEQEVTGVWDLARKFREFENVFSHTAYVINRCS